MHASTCDVRSVPEQIAELSKANPQSIALSGEHRQLSYADLDRSGDRFAAYLMQLGVTPGDTVAICMERSFDWIVAALGIMRAGAGYVPLDSAWPDARLRYAGKDSGAVVLVARAALLDRLQVEARGVDPCRDAESIANAREGVHRSIPPDALAYVIYTSGSSGSPKGVEIQHANLANLIQWHCDAFKVMPQDRVSHLLGLGFDASVLEIWAHLCAGASLCFVDDAVRSSPELTQQWMVREQITISIVPAVLGECLMTMEWPTETTLRLLISGGDKLQRGPVAGLPFKVVNQYGPTECSVVSTWTVLEPGVNGAPPIGRPVPGATIYLLDELGELVADGEVGEIYIGGSVVGRGYRSLPELTERAFLPNRFASTPNARMYRTGDRGLRRPDGQFEFRGRLDRQTKIRGYRVELDEIGSILTEHPEIAFATAIAGLSDGGEIQLVAHVLPRGNERVPTAQELQQYLRGSLPDYMIPAIFVRLHELPLSPNGKLDLTMLPNPAEANRLERSAENEFVSLIENKLLFLVRELLENKDIGSGDDFFLSGGHSLLGTQLLMRLQNSLGVDLTLRELFEAPTVQSLAQLVETKLIDAVDSMSDEEAETQILG
jgi:amino acid adenylation domain-containing protein